MAFPPPAARSWVTFPHPDDPDHEVRADLSWLLSRWSCIYGSGCQGIVAGAAAAGCCSHGAFLSDKADEKRVKAAARELSPDDWQRHRTRPLVVTDELDGAPARRTATADGACVFLNDETFAGGAGCALHALALRTGRHPLQTKPDVCWQLPVRRESERRPDGTLLTTVGEFSRRGWGPGGADLHWWCTEAASAHTGAEPLYRSYAAELTALLGAAGYAELARLCADADAGRPALLPLLPT